MADQNARLLLFLKRLADSPAGFRAAHLHVSQLMAAKKTRDNISRAITILTELRTKYKNGDIFLMKNLDIVFIAKDIPRHVMATCCESIQHAFIGSLSPDFTNVHGNVNEFYTLFDLVSEVSQFMSWAENAAGLAKATNGEPQASPKGAIDLAMLSRIKEEILKIDISPMLFNQPVYLVGEADRPTVMFHEMYISVQVLEEMFCPGLSLSSRRWLFTDLTEELDTVVLRRLASGEGRSGRKRISINVNLASLNSPKFVKFDSDLPLDYRQGVILEINKTDVFENMRLYRELVPYLRDRGYRVLVDGLSFLNVAAIDFDGIECDFVKVFWSNDILSLADDVKEHILAKMRFRETPRLLLARCDTADSLRFARSIGIRLVQGRLADHMVKKNIPF
jgi:hypothetical protein